MYKQQAFFRKFPTFLLIAFFYIFFASIAYASDPLKQISIKENPEAINSSVYQEELDKIEKDIESLRKELYQNIIEKYNQSIDASNRLINFVGWTATIFGILIALAGLFIGFESIRSRQRREEAIKTLEDAKLYIENRIVEFDKIIKEKSIEVKKLIQLFLDQLSQDTEEAVKKVEEKSAMKIKEIEEKDIILESEKKIELLEKRIKLFEEIGLPDDPKLLYSKAILCEEKEMLSESLKLLEKAIKLDPEYKNAHWRIGWIQDKLGNYEKSVEAYDEAIKLDPKDASAYNNKGISLRRLDRKEEALECYNKAIELFPKESLYYKNKADILKELEKYEEALEVINQSIELNPLVEFNYTAASRILNKMKKIEEALKYYQKAGEIEKEKANKLDAGEVDFLNYFETILILKNYKEAIKWKSKIQNKIKSKEYIYIFYFLSSCLSFLKSEKTKGMEQISQIIENFEKNPLEKPADWNFEDMNPFLESRLHKDLYELCITVEKLLIKEISLSECKEKIRKLKNKV